MTRTMVDAYLASNWPDTGWDLGAAYINGTSTSQNYATARLRFPHAHILTITTDATFADADICDCESGDYTPGRAATWARWRIATGHRPTIYSNRATWPLILDALRSETVNPADVDWWASTLDGTEGPDVACPDGNTYRAVAVQYAQGPQGRYDLSIVYDDTWHPTPRTAALGSLVPVTTAPTAGALRRRKRMLVIVSDGTEQWLCGVPDNAALSTGWRHHLANPAIGAAWARQLGVDDVPTDPSFVHEIANIVA